MRRYTNILAILLLAVAFTSCEKVIPVDLNDSDPKLVIEAQVGDHDGPYWVALTRSVNFDESNDFPEVTDAEVIITDSEGNTEMLEQALDGLYVTNNLEGVPGRSYTLDITVDGVTYTAVSTMPAPIEIDTIKFKNGFFPGTKIVDVSFQDIPGEDNYFLMLQYQNGYSFSDGTFPLGSDQLTDGEEITFTFLYDEGEISPADTMTYELYVIDEGVFDYFRTLNQLADAGNSASPANPITNFTNNPLGYFSAHAVRRKAIVLPEF